MRKFVIILSLILITAPFALAHEGEEEIMETPPTPFTPVNAIFMATAIIAIVIILSIVLRDRMGERGKKTAFALIAGPIIFSTAFLIGDTIYLNLVSESGGLVHWHADFTIGICGERQHLARAQGFDNKVGTGTLHHHDEGVDLGGVYRIHVEGVILDLSEVDLGHFFEAIGGELTNESLTITLHDRSVRTVRNGDLCPDSHAGELKVLVNNKRIPDPENYIISPYTNVPPGDFIEIMFD